MFETVTSLSSSVHISQELLEGKTDGGSVITQAKPGAAAVPCRAVPCLWEEGSLADAVSLFQGELLSPCRCDGSVKCTHQPCLIKWISERGCWSCELCYYKYHVIAISTKNPLQVKVLETFQSLFILVSIFVSGSKWILPTWVFLSCAQ